MCLKRSLSQNPSLRKMRTVSSYFPSTINPFIKCTKSILPPSGLPIKSTSIMTIRIGISSIRKKSTLSSMFWLSSQLVMELFLRIWQNNFALRFKSHKLDAFMGSKLRWKTSIHKLIPSSLTPTSKIKIKKNTSLKRSPTLMWSKKKHNGQWNGWIKENPFMKDW